MSALPAFDEEVELLLAAAKEAGEIALPLANGVAKVWTKNGTSPVSEADIAIDRFLQATLRKARPGYGYLSEETPDDGTRLTAPRTFVVDPIDGTRAFISSGRDWTIPIAVVEAGRPIAAVLYAPARNEMYRATAECGAFLNDEPIAVSGRAELEGSTLAVSQRLLRFSPVPITARTVFHASLAYRLARIADGRVDGVAIKANAQDWDLAAADLLVHEAGGALIDLDGDRPRYDRADTAHPPLLAGVPPLCAQLRELALAALAQGA